MLLRREVIGTCARMAGTAAVLDEFVDSWGNLIQYNAEYMGRPDAYVHYMKPITSYHSAARNQLAANFLGPWLWMTDADHSFPPDIVLRMVQMADKHGIDVLSGLYRYRHPPFLPVAYQWVNNAFAIIAEMDWNAPLIQVDCAGGGCLLVRRRVFDRIREELHEEPFDVVHPLSEDFSFFRRLMKLGIPAFVSPQIYSTHLRVSGVTEDMGDPTSVPMVPIIRSGGANVVALERKV